MDAPDPELLEPSSAPLVCIVCESERGRAIFRDCDVDILRCEECGHVYSSYRVPQAYDGFFSENVGDNVAWWEAYRAPMYRDFARQFLAGRSGRLLDIGSGLGYFLKFAHGFPSWEGHGVETSEPAVTHAREVNRLERVVHGRAEDCDFPPGHFDLVTMWDFVEHVPDPRPLIDYAHTCLTEGGRLFVSTPNIQVHLPKARLRKRLFGQEPGRYALEARDHMNNFSPSSLEKIFRDAGFGQIRFLHLHPVQAVAFSNRLRMTGLKNLWYHSARLLHAASFGLVNLDNLYVEARKSASEIQT